MDTSPAVGIKQLTKKYNGTNDTALDNLNLSLSWGESYGFIGPNGAGKSTTIRLIMNFLQPTSGEIVIDNKIVGTNPAIYNNIGYLSGDFTAYPKLTGHEFLDYMQALSAKKNTQNIKKLSALFELDLHKKIGSLSKGNRQKIGLIHAFMSNPGILILDEPTSGLDPLKQEVFFDLVTSAKQRGACVFLSSHNLSEVQKICDKVGIIRHGKLVHESTIADIERKTAQQALTITFAVLPPTTKIASIPGVTQVKKIAKNTLSIQTEGQLSPLLSAISKHTILRLETQEFDLESAFMSYYNERAES